MYIYCITLIPVKKQLKNDVEYHITGHGKMVKQRRGKYRGREQKKECGEIMKQDINNPLLYTCKNEHTRFWPPQENDKRSIQI